MASFATSSSCAALSTRIGISGTRPNRRSKVSIPRLSGRKRSTRTAATTFAGCPPGLSSSARRFRPSEQSLTHSTWKAPSPERMRASRTEWASWQSSWIRSMVLDTTYQTAKALRMDSSTLTAQPSVRQRTWIKSRGHSIERAAVRTQPHRRDRPVVLALPRACRSRQERCEMGLILIIVVVILLLGGGGGYYGYSRYGGSGLGGALSLVLLVLLLLWFFGGLHIQRCPARRDRDGAAARLV